MAISRISYVGSHDYCERTSIFKQKLNADIKELNTLIDSYNALTDMHERKSALIVILREKSRLEQSYSGRYIRACGEFVEQIHYRLFTELQCEFMACGVNNLHGIGEDLALPMISSGDTFSHLLANMSPQKLVELTNFLLGKDIKLIRHSLQKLYAEHDLDAPLFGKFLIGNKITFLSVGNNKLFKIEPHNGAEPYILKMEIREAGPELPEEILRKGSLKGRMLPSGAKRQCVADKKTYTISTIPFCNGHDLLTHIEARQSDQSARLRDVLIIYNQMVTVLLTMQDNHIAFPDMKNSNWLISPDNQLFISDSKSFLTANPADNTLSRDTVFQSTKGGIVNTDYFLAPEVIEKFLKAGQPISIDKMHAYMLGLNMYQYLVACGDDAVVAKRRNMAMPVFTGSTLGQFLGKIVQGLLDENLDRRMSLVDAQYGLKRALDLFRSSTASANCCVESVLEYSCIDGDTAALPPTSLVAASSKKGLLQPQTSGLDRQDQSQSHALLSSMAGTFFMQFLAANNPFTQANDDEDDDDNTCCFM